MQPGPLSLSVAVHDSISQAGGGESTLLPVHLERVWRFQKGIALPIACEVSAGAPSTSNDFLLAICVPSSVLLILRTLAHFRRTATAKNGRWPAYDLGGGFMLSSVLPAEAIMMLWLLLPSGCQ